MSKNIPGRRLSGAKNSAIQQEVEKANGIRVFHRCGGCGKKQEFLNSGKFRAKRQREQPRRVVDLPMQKMQAFLEPHHL